MILDINSHFMIFVVKIQLKKLSGRFLQTFLITKTAFLLTIGTPKLEINNLQTYGTIQQF